MERYLFKTQVAQSCMIFDFVGTIGVNEDLYAEIYEIFEGKSLAELLELETSMKEKISEDGPVDIEYWENLLKELQIFKAKVRSFPCLEEICCKSSISCSTICCF